MICKFDLNVEEREGRARGDVMDNMTDLKLHGRNKKQHP